MIINLQFWLEEKIYLLEIYILRRNRKITSFQSDLIESNPQVIILSVQKLRKNYFRFEIFCLWKSVIEMENEKPLNEKYFRVSYFMRIYLLTEYLRH